jgi:hypothetical protein
MANDSVTTLSVLNSTWARCGSRKGVRQCLIQQAKWTFVLLVASALPWAAQAQRPVSPAQLPVPPLGKKPAGADRGVLLSVAAEKDLQMAPPSAAIFNFGIADRFLHPVLTHTFTLRNDGKVPVPIDHIQSSCGCTSALLIAAGKERVGYTLQPGKQISIKTAVDTTKLAPGPIKKYLWVMMPGETVPSFIIRLDADIEGVLAFSPPAVEFGRVEAGETPAQTLDVMLDTRLLEAVGGVQLVSSNPGVHIGPAVPTDIPVPGGDGHTVRRTYAITLKPEVTLGVLSGTLSFVPLKSAAVANKSNIKAAAETAATFLNALTANVTGEVFGSVSARPGTIVFGAVTQGETTTRRITLVGKTAETFKNLKVTSASTWVTAKLSVPERSKPDPNTPLLKLPPMLLLEVTLNPKAPPGALQTQLTVTTQEGERLLLPAFGYVTPAVKPAVKPARK